MPRIDLDSITYGQIVRYATTAKIPVGTAVAQMVQEWMETTGEPLLEGVAANDANRIKPKRRSVRNMTT
jgi:hypothetical protein